MRKAINIAKRLALLDDYDKSKLTSRVFAEIMEFNLAQFSIGESREKNWKSKTSQIKDGHRYPEIEKHILQWLKLEKTKRCSYLFRLEALRIAK